jgi:transposase
MIDPSIEPQQTEEKIAILTKFIQTNPGPRELKRDLAVKMALQNESYALITKLLSMHKSCISSWKQKFLAQGLSGIKLGYKGAKSYLTPLQRMEVIDWLKLKNYWI